MQMFAFVIVRKSVQDGVGDDGKPFFTKEKIVLPKEASDGPRYYFAEERKPEIAILVPLLKELAGVGIGEHNIDEVCVRYPFVRA